MRRPNSLTFHFMFPTLAHLFRGNGRSRGCLFFEGKMFFCFCLVFFAQCTLMTHHTGNTTEWGTSHDRSDGSVRQLAWTACMEPRSLPWPNCHRAQRVTSYAVCIGESLPPGCIVTRKGLIHWPHTEGGLSIQCAPTESRAGSPTARATRRDKLQKIRKSFHLNKN